MSSITNSKHLKGLHVVKPHVFHRKLFLMAALIVAMGLGVASTDQTVKRACAILAALPPLMCAFESLAYRRQQLKKNVLFVIWINLTLLLLWTAILTPTLLCQFSIGALLAHGTELAHQALHKTGTGKRYYDTQIGSVLYGATLASFNYIFWSHLRHHKLNGTEHDRESFSYFYKFMDSDSRLIRLLGFFCHFTMAGQYLTAFKRMAMAVTGRLQRHLLASHPDMPSKVAAQVEKEYQGHALILLCVVILSVYFQTTLVLDLWLIPLLIGWGPTHSLIELTEHWHCDRLTSDVFRNTRSIKAGIFARWYTNFNNCHIGHHKDKSVPAEQLPAFEIEVAKLNHFKYVEESYPDFYLRFFRFLWTGHNKSNCC